MMSLKRSITILGFAISLLLSSRQMLAQQYPVFTQYYFNELVINPAYAGAHVQLSLNSTYRNQWVNFPGAPRTVSISGHTSLVNGKVGVGLLVNNDIIGSYNNQNVFSYYSYKIHFNKGVLSMGLQAGFNLLRVDFSKLTLVDLTDQSFLPANSLRPNVGAGLYYSKHNFFAGFSVPFILTNTSQVNPESTLSQVTEARYYFFRTGGIIPVGMSKNISLNPSILVRAQEGQPLSIDLNAGVILYDLFSTGVSWRSGDAFITFVDFKITEKFHFAYSYDWTASSLRKYSNGSHEFMINYRAKVTKSQKGLPCPTYYHYGTLEPAKVKKKLRFNRERKK